MFFTFCNYQPNCYFDIYTVKSKNIRLVKHKGISDYIQLLHVAVECINFSKDLYDSIAGINLFSSTNFLHV